MSQPAPANSTSLSALMAQVARRNATLLHYLYPTSDVTTDPNINWVPYLPQCELRTDCYCHHVEGDMSRARNPDGWKKCTYKFDIHQCPSCACLSGTPCLFSDMRPTKLLAIIAAARAAGVTHLIEEGRFGGLSALMYALHGFEVTSIEFLPLTGVSAALGALAPSVRLLDGDGRQLLPRLLLPPAEGGEGALDPARVGVIFDGEKRFGAYATWQKVKHRAAFAVFDDTNLGDGDEFVAMLERERETWWETTDMLFEEYRRAEVAPLNTLLGPLRRARKKVFAGIDRLGEFHLAIVRGGGWAGSQVYIEPGAGVRAPHVRRGDRRKAEKFRTKSHSQHQRLRDATTRSETLARV